MISKEEKDLILKYKEEGKTVSEISTLTNLTYNQVYRYYNLDKTKKYEKEYYEQNKEKRLRQVREYYQNNREERLEYAKKYEQEHYIKKERPKKEKQIKVKKPKMTEEDKKAKRKLYKEAHKEEIKLSKKLYRESHKEQEKARAKKYNEEHKEEIKKRKREYRARKILADPNFRIEENLRSRIRLAVYSQKARKLDRTIKLLGCDYEQLKRHLESQFRDGMNWENYGKVWQVDHIVPCAAFDLTKEEQQKECFNYKNLQPLLVEENQSKNDFLPSGKRGRAIRYAPTFEVSTEWP